jgi:hypothetical protein
MNNNKYTFDIELYDKHLIIHDQDNIILVDTGSPTTLHNKTEFEFCGRKFQSSSSNLLTNIDDVSNLLGMRITTLLGTDILSQYKIVIDYRERQFILSENKLEEFGHLIPFDFIQKIPVLELEIKNRKMRFFLDSGAKISYLDSDLTTHLNSKGQEEDFYPGIGSFSTPIYEVLTQIGGHGFNANYGNLPKNMEQLLRHNQIQGIIGFDFFMNFRVGIDFEDNKINIENFLF